jgi:CRISPR/Cas system-associated endoribonuclease Cas2
MAAFLVTYDLVGTDATSENYAKLIAEIKTTTWAHVQDSVWIVLTTESAQQIFSRLWHHMHSTDRLFVLRSGREAWWGNTMCSSDWLQANL